MTYIDFRLWHATEAQITNNWKWGIWEGFLPHILCLWNEWMLFIYYYRLVILVFYCFCDISFVGNMKNMHTFHRHIHKQAIKHTDKGTVINVSVEGVHIFHILNKPSISTVFTMFSFFTAFLTKHKFFFIHESLQKKRGNDHI